MDSFDQDGFMFGAGVSAEVVGRMQRRIRFLEAALVQVLRDDTRLKEWFSSAELAAFRLPDLPRSASGMTRHAKDNGWENRIVRGPRGEMRVYHFSSLPRRAFDAMLERVLRNPTQDEELSAMVPHVPVTPPREGRKGGAPTPQWLLPLMRIMRSEPMPVGRAVLLLPVDTATGRRPELGEVVEELQRMGMLG